MVGPENLEVGKDRSTLERGESKILIELGKNLFSAAKRFNSYAIDKVVSEPKSGVKTIVKAQNLDGTLKLEVHDYKEAGIGLFVRTEKKLEDGFFMDGFHISKEGKPYVKVDPTYGQAWQHVNVEANTFQEMLDVFDDAEQIQRNLVTAVTFSV